MTSPDFRLIKIDELRNKKQWSMTEKHKRVFKALYYFKLFLIFIPAASGCISIFEFASLTGVPVGTTSFAIGLKIVQSLQKLKSTSEISRKKIKKTTII